MNQKGNGMNSHMKLDWNLPPNIAVLMLRSTVLFPMQVASVQIGMKQNLRLLADHSGSDVVVAAGVFVEPEGAYKVGNLSLVAMASKILSRVQMSHGTTQVVLQGLGRIELKQIESTQPYFTARADYPPDTNGDERQVEDLVGRVASLVESLVGTDKRYTDEFVRMVRFNLDDPSRCADLIADTVQFSYVEKRQALEATAVSTRLGLLARLLEHEVHRAQVAGEVRVKAEGAIDRTHRQEALREQLSVIRRELIELDPAEGQIAELAEKVRQASLPAAVAQQAQRDIQRLRKGDVDTLEETSIRAYIEWVLSLPWQDATKASINIGRARRLLNKRYLGLGAARDRLLEFLAVRNFGGTTKPLLAIVGPPGTGKTSLARSLGAVLDRPCLRIPAGGIHEEVQIHGSRRTEVAAKPGQILDGIRETGVSNPIMIVDDIHRLDEGLLPALLDALDPARNSHFLDHYLGVPFDLSKTLVVITANVEEEIPYALWDCVDVVTLSGYTDSDKVTIAADYVWPQVVRHHGLEGHRIRLTPAALRKIISEYTKEAGVAGLTVRLETLCRRIALALATDGVRRHSISLKNLEEYLGPPTFKQSPNGAKPLIGAATGLAWTESGGALLPVEALLMPGSGITTVTGLLGEVLRESVQAALSYVRSRADELDIPQGILNEKDLHVHFPEGAIPKDGPSAGIAVATAIASLLSGRPIPGDMAMTGEISLRGQVLGVGGIHEKVLAAYRAGVRHVILPRANESDVTEIPGDVRRKIQIHLVDNVAEVFNIALDAGTGRDLNRRRKKG
jgi:ATP-dependent Lon protease